MSEFVISSEREVKLTFHSRQVTYEGWLVSYRITAEARNFRAEIDVENTPHGDSPAAFFAGMAKEWSGWQGKKAWGTIEGEYELSATRDSVGHITLVAGFNPHAFPPSWSGQLILVIDAGQLEKFSGEANAFFNETAQPAVLGDGAKARRA